MDDHYFHLLVEGLVRGLSIGSRGILEDRMRGEKTMDVYGCPPAGAGESMPSSVEVHIRRVENGYICRVLFPKHLVPDPMVEKAESVFSTLGKAFGEGEGPGQDPGDFFKSLSGLVSKMKKIHRPLRKPEETYIFQDSETMLKFIKETFETSEDKGESAEA